MSVDFTSIRRNRVEDATSEGTKAYVWIEPGGSLIAESVLFADNGAPRVEDPTSGPDDATVSVEVEGVEGLAGKFWFNHSTFGDQSDGDPVPRDIHYNPFSRGKIRRSALWDPVDVDKERIRIDAGAVVSGNNNVGEDVSILGGTNNLHVPFTADWVAPGWANLPNADYDIAAAFAAQRDHYTPTGFLPAVDFLGRNRSVGVATDAGAHENP